MPLISTEPTPDELPDLMLAGTCSYADYFANDQMGLFGQTWERLMHHMHEVPNRVNAQRNFGMSMYPPEFPQDHRWYYCACVEVASLATRLPSNMLCRFVPAAKYLKFSVRGPVTDIAPAFRYVYEEWLPKANVTISGTYDLELYDVEFKDPCDPESVSHILLPLA